MSFTEEKKTFTKNNLELHMFKYRIIHFIGGN